jgi:hypothetical protein
MWLPLPALKVKNDKKIGNQKKIEMDADKTIIVLH